MKKRKSKMNDELRPEYDLHQLLKGAVRGKYAKRYKAGTNLFCWTRMSGKPFAMRRR